MSAETTQLILKEKPDVLVLGGPPSYLSGVRVEASLISRGLTNAARIASVVPTLIFEHHILRSESWKTDSKPVYEASAKAGNQVVTAAEYMGEPPMLLEARREDLYREEAPSPEFMRWTQLKNEKRRVVRPPI
jgi:hypothetical protein